MMPATGGDPEHATARHLQVVQRVLRPTLANHERDPCGDGDHGQRRHQGAFVGNGCEVDRQDQRAHQDDREDASQVVDGVARLVDVGGDVPDRQHECDDGERQGDEEHRSPVVVLEQRPRGERSERGDGAADAGPQGDRSGACRSGPQGGDQGQRGGEGHARREAAQDAGGAEHAYRWSDGRQDCGRYRQEDTADRHQLPPVAVPHRTEVQHRGGESERVADGDEVQRCLRGVELQADRGEGDVGHREVQVRHGRHQDERHEHQAAVLRRGAGDGGRTRVPLDAHRRLLSARWPR